MTSAIMTRPSIGGVPWRPGVRQNHPACAAADEGIRVPERDLTTLLAAAGRNDQSAWEELVARFTSYLWAIARSSGLDRATAGDAVQTTWLRLVDNLDHISDPERLPGWLGTTMRRECLHLTRRAGRETPTADDWWLDALPSTDPPPDAALLTAERDRALWAAFELLSAPCKRLLRVLTASPPPTYAAVAEALELPVGSIGPTRQRCLARLRTLLAADPLPGGPARGAR